MYAKAVLIALFVVTFQFAPTFAQDALPEQADAASERPASLEEIKLRREIDKLAAAEGFVSDFSIGTECGFDRRDATIVPELLHIHVEAAV